MNNEKIFEFLFAGGGTWNITLAFIDDVSNVFRLINLILGTILLLIAVGIKIKNWIKKSKADGKITPEEIQEGVEIVVDGVNQVENLIEEGKKK